jgi:subtilisin family serine protease
LSRTASKTSAPWHLDRLDQRGLPLDRSFEYAHTGAGVNIYILDSGIRTTHVQFGGERSVPTLPLTMDAVPMIAPAHGTMVAAAAAGGTFGVAKQAKVFAVRVLDCSGSGATSSIVAGVDWVTRNASRPAVANMSLGATTSTTLSAAVAASSRRASSMS